MGILVPHIPPLMSSSLGISQEGLGPSPRGLEASFLSLAGPETNPFPNVSAGYNPGVNSRI